MPELKVLMPIFEPHTSSEETAGPILMEFDIDNRPVYDWVSLPPPFPAGREESEVWGGKEIQGEKRGKQKFWEKYNFWQHQIIETQIKTI